MATFTKLYCFVEDLAEKKHDLGSDTLKVLLTNTAPELTDTHVDTDLAVCTLEPTSLAEELADGYGYTKGGNSAAISSSSQTAGVYTLVLADPATWTASGGSIGPFRYAVLYNNSGGTSSTRPALGWWDYGTSITLAASETFKVDFDAVTGVLSLT